MKRFADRGIGEGKRCFRPFGRAILKIVRGLRTFTTMEEICNIRGAEFSQLFHEVLHGIEELRFPFGHCGEYATFGGWLAEDAKNIAICELVSDT